MIGTYRAGLGRGLAGHASGGRDGEGGESGDGVHRVKRVRSNGSGSGATPLSLVASGKSIVIYGPHQSSSG